MPDPQPSAELERALAWLSSFTDYEQKAPDARHRFPFDLRRMERMCAVLGDPHLRVPCFHITGTKGKSSTAYLAEEILRGHGLRTFRFLSPHLESITERLAIDGAPVAPGTFEALAESLRPLVEGRPREEWPTFFEAITLMGFLLAAREAVDASVVEVGLGGRLDATNVVRPELAAITSIGLDHQRLLGDTLAAIGGEKAGIFKPKTPALTAVPPWHEAFATIAARAEELGCPFRAPGPELEVVDLRVSASHREPARLHFGVRGKGISIDGLEMRAGAEHQAWNALLAIEGAAALLLARGRELDAQTVRTALAGCRLPGRLEWFEGSPPVVLDGAHTKESLEDLMTALEPSCAGVHLVAICGLTKDRDPVSTLAAVRARAQRVFTTAIPTPRSASATDLAREVGAEAVADPREALARARAAAGPSGLVLACGSLYLAGALRPELRRGSPPRRD